MPGKDKRPNSKQRRVLRALVAKLFGLSDSFHVCKTMFLRCRWCDKLMFRDEEDPAQRWQLDRYPVCGHNGGQYRIGNVVPCCPQCNARRCHKKVGWCLRRKYKHRAL